MLNPFLTYIFNIDLNSLILPFGKRLFLILFIKDSSSNDSHYGYIYLLNKFSNFFAFNVHDYIHTLN